MSFHGLSGVRRGKKSSHRGQRSKGGFQTGLLRIELLERRDLLSVDAGLSAAAATPSYRFIVVGDSRGSDAGGINATILTELASRVVAEGAQLLLFPGDLVTTGSLSAFQQWKTDMKPVYDAGIGVAAVAGNHDVPGIADFKTQFITPLQTTPFTGETNFVVDSTTADGRSYAFNYQNALFVGLDNYANASTGYHKVNQTFLDAQLKNRNAHTTPLVFAFDHEPAFKVGDDTDLSANVTARNTFWTSLKNAGAREFFAGHDHEYVHTNVQDNPTDNNTNNDVHQVVAGGGGAPLADYVAPTDTTPYLPIDVYHEKQYGYLRVDVTGTTVTQTWVHRTGTNTYADTSEKWTYTVGTSNNAPVANADSMVTQRNAAIAIPVLVNDTDADNDTLSLTGVTQPAHGTAAINADKTVTYTPTPGYSGADAFTYTISDGYGGAATGSVAVTVNPPGTAQTVTFQQKVAGYQGTLDTYLQENSPTANNAAATALNVDSDDPASSGKDVQALLWFRNIMGGGYGQIPTDAQIQSATLQLQVTNSGNTFNLNRVLQSWADTATWTSMTGGVQADDVEAAKAVDVATGTVATGALSLNVLNSVTAWQTTANYGWAMLPTGSDGVDFYSAQGTTPPKLTVTFIPAPVDAAPLAVADTATTPEENPVTVSVLANDSDPDGDTLTVTGVTQGTHGAVVLNADNTVTYSPVLNYNGGDSFGYTISDGHGGTASATVSVTVTAVNDPPFGVPDTATTPEETPVAIAVAANDTDGDGDTLTVTAVTQCLHGAVVINGDNTVTYTPALDYNGADWFGYTISDGHGGTASATVSVTVTPVNDLPQVDAIATTATILEDAATQTIALTGIAAGGGESQTLAISATSSNTALIAAPTVAYTSPNATGTVTYKPTANQSGTSTITITLRDAGLDRVLNTTDDGVVAQTCVVTVTAVNDAPTLNSISNRAAILQGAGQQSVSLAGITAGGGESQTLAVSASSSNTNLLPSLSVTYTSPNSTGTLKYTPAPAQSGTATVTVTVRDAGLNGILNDSDDATYKRTFTVTVTPNQAPVATNKSVSVVANSAAAALGIAAPTDANSDTLYITITQLPTTAQGTVTLSDGATAVTVGQVLTVSQLTGLMFKPTAGYTGTATSLQYLVADRSVPASGLQGYWMLNDASGTTASDASAHGLKGTLTNGPVWSTGKIGGGLTLDGTNDFVSLGNPTSLNFAGQITLSAWVQPQASDGLRNIIAHGYTSSPNAEVFLRINAGKYEVGSYNGTSYSASYTIPSGDLNTWVHLVGVYDGTTWRLYRNGVQVATKTATVGAITVGANWAIGARGDGTSRYYKGLVDDVRIYNRGLTATEVTAMAAGMVVGGKVDITVTSAATSSALAAAAAQDLAWLNAADALASSHAKENHAAAAKAIDAILAAYGE